MSVLTGKVEIGAGGRGRPILNFLDGDKDTLLRYTQKVLKMECPECHNIFNPIVVKATRKFCSFSCKRKASKKRWLAKNRLKKVKVLFCLNCGKPIESPKIRYCSDKCADMYYRDNLRDKEKARQYKRASQNKRKKTLTYKVRKRISERIRCVLNGERHGITYSGGVITYTEDQIKSHLEKQFQDGMSWENYGTVWHIDHKIPVSAFNLHCEEDIKRCWSLKNLQPMFAEENVKKSDKLSKPFQPMLI